MRVLVWCVVTAAFIAGCSPSEPVAAPSPEPITPTSPIPVVSEISYDEASIQLSRLAQVFIDELLGRGNISIAALPIDELPPYGPVLLVRIERLDDANLTRAASTVLIAVAQSLLELRKADALPIEIGYAGFEDPTGAIAIARVDDLIDRMNGALTTRALLNGVVYIDR